MEELKELQEFFQQQADKISESITKSISKKLQDNKKFRNKDLKFRKLNQMLEKDLKECLQEFQNQFQTKLQLRIEDYKTVLDQSKNKTKKVELYDSYDEQSSTKSQNGQEKIELESSEENNSLNIENSPQNQVQKKNSFQEENFSEQSGIECQLEDSDIIEEDLKQNTTKRQLIQIVSDFDKKLSEQKIATMKDKETNIISTKVEIPTHYYRVIDCNKTLPQHKEDKFKKMPDLTGCMMQFPAFNINVEENKVYAVDRNKRISKQTKQKYKTRVIAEARRWGYQRIAEMYFLPPQKVLNWLIQSGYVKSQKKCSVMSYLSDEMIKELEREEDLTLY